MPEGVFVRIFNNVFRGFALALLTVSALWAGPVEYCQTQPREAGFHRAGSVKQLDQVDSKTFDLNAAIKRGLEYNPSLLAIKENLLGAEQGIKSARGAFGPSLSTSYSYIHLDREPEQNGIAVGDQENWVLNLNIHLPLFTGFNLLSNYEKSLLAKDQAMLQLKQARLQLVFEIRQSFFDLLQAKENLKSARLSLERLKSHLKISQAFYDVGLKPKLDVLQAQVELAKAEQGLLVAQNAVQTQRARLNFLLNLDVNEDVHYSGTLEFVPFVLGLEECLAKAQKNRPDLKLASKSILLASKESKIVASSFYPQVGADLNYYRYGDEPIVDGSKFQRPSEWRAGVSLQWKLFEWGKTYYTYKQTRHRVSELEAEYKNLQNQISFEVKAAYLKIKEAAQRIVVARKGVEEARESYRLARARYEAQVGTNTDVLDAQFGLASSEANLTQAMADYLKAIANIYLAMGEPDFERLTFCSAR